MGLVVKASAKLSEPRWLIADADGMPCDFGSRENAVVFPTRDLAEAQAQRWARRLEPMLSVTVEPSEDVSA